jgi:hypothetical protein|nr:MAG TPA: hypothetical protein [Caudoviricetes sp.]
MNIPENTTPSRRARSAKKYAASYRRKVDRINAADWKHAHHTDPSTGRVQAINIRHS